MTPEERYIEYRKELDKIYNNGEIRIDTSKHRILCDVCKKIDISLIKRHTDIQLYDKLNDISYISCVCIPCAIDYLPMTTNLINFKIRDKRKIIPQYINEIVY